MNRIMVGLGALWVASSVGGCSSSSTGGGGGNDAGTKDATTSGVDAGIDSGVDAGIDSGVEAGIDSGVDAGIDSGVDAGIDSGVDAAVCTPGTQQCSGTGVETCGANGQWGTPWSCVTGTCTGGACTGSTTTGQSCQTSGAGLTNCGATSESCCTSLEVAGGTYYRTFDSEGSDGGATFAADGGPGGEADPASVSDFRLDKYEVTVGRFRQFVSAVLPPDGGAGYAPTAASGKHTHLNAGQGLVNAGSDAGIAYETGWVASDDANIAPTSANLACAIDPTWTAAAGGNENKPINCVNAYEAYAFCIWDGGFLPSESEWEYVAAGGNQQREYPWGLTGPGTGNQYAIYNCCYPTGTCNSCSPGAANIAPVGTATLGAGLWGQLDLAGSVFEWNLDSDNGFFHSYPAPCTDCAVLTPSTYQVYRGGYWFDPSVPGYMLTSNRIFNTSTFRSGFLGFRCARTP